MAYDTGEFVPNVAGVLTTDITLLLMMLVGIIRMKEARKFGVARFLYYQVRLSALIDDGIPWH